MVRTAKVVLLLSFMSCISAYITTEAGKDVIFNLSLPGAVLKERRLTVTYSFDKVDLFDVENATQSVFYYENQYKTRVNVTSYLPGERIIFTLYKVTREDAGVYVCLTTSHKSIKECGELLIVLGEPSKPVILTEENGTALMLSCSSNSTSLPPNHNLSMSYIWKENTKVLDKESRSQWRITKNMYGANYSCQAKEERGLKSDWSDLQYGPEKVILKPDKNVVVVMKGDPLEVVCSGDCNPACEVTWWNQNRSSVIEPTATLFWPKTSVTMGGRYICEVKNIFGRQTRNITVNVQYPPHITRFTVNKSTSSLTVRENQSVTFECPVEGYPQPSVSFVSLPDQDVMSSGFSSSYQIHSVQCSHYGRYQCIATNSIQPATNESVDLKVMCEPKLHILVNVLPGTWNISLWSYPEPHLTDFYFTGHGDIVRLDLSNKKYKIVFWNVQENLHGLTFVIKNYASSDEGTYIFTFDNTEGKRNISLQVGEIADPSLFLHGSAGTITIAAGTSLLIVVAAVIAAVFIHRYKNRAGAGRYRGPYECGDDTDDKSYLYARVDKSRKPVTDVYATVKKTPPAPKMCANRLYVSGGPMPENQALIHDAVEDGMSGTANNNCGEQNAEGLNYADLDLPPPTMKDGQPVIRCSEEPVLYEQIDFARTPGPQLPEKIWEKEMRDLCMTDQR